MMSMLIRVLVFMVNELTRWDTVAHMAYGLGVGEGRTDDHQILFLSSRDLD